MKNRHKTYTIYNWKKSKIISEDFNKLYENHMSINNCQLCNVLFDNEINNNRRTLDHDHRTGLYRQTICNKCNKGFDIIRNNKSGHKYIYIEKQKSKNNLCIFFRYKRFINNKEIRKASISKTKLIMFSFIQELKYNYNYIK